MASPVKTKYDFVRRYRLGEFGNASRTWDSLNELLANGQSGCTGLYHLRNREVGGQTWYNLSLDDLIGKWQEVTKNVLPGSLYISEMEPAYARRIIQGEVWRGPTGLELTYTTIQKPMRDALAEAAIRITGLAAKMLLQRSMSPKSIEWLWQLLDIYEDHVVEFTTYTKAWGTIPGYDTLFWEVRLY